MAHLPYADLNAPELRPLVERIVAERGSVLHLYQMPQQAALELADTMTRDVHVAPEPMREVRTHLDDRPVVELVGAIAAYNMVSRFLEALQIHSGDARQTAS